MTFAEMYTRAELRYSDGKIFVPPGYDGETVIIIPDNIVYQCIGIFDLCKPGLKVLDPFAGLGTIPRVINAHGGNAIGIEVDSHRYEAARSVSKPESLISGSFLTTDLKPHSFDVIFTSMPFSWFSSQDEKDRLSPRYAHRLRELLKQDGFLLLDSLARVHRNGDIWPVAQLQTEYLEGYDFNLTEVHTFQNTEHLDQDSESLILKFV